MSENVQGKSGLFSWLNENFEKIFMVTGLLAIILFITWQVIYRYIITQFIERAGAAVWTEELSRYIFIWISYLALSVAIKKRSSIRVDIIYDKLPERLQNISWIIVESLFLVLTGVITYFGWGQIERLLTFPQHTTALRIPFLVPYLILPLGFGLMCLRLLQRIWGQMRVCGALDSLLGFALALGILSPWYLVDYIDPLPVLFGYFALLCVIGVPIAISLGLSTLATIICSQTLPIEYMAQVCFTSIDSFPIMAIPFFIAAGEYMGAGGLSKRLLNLADEIVGGLYGGIGLTAVVTCMFFGAISGSGPATVAAIGALTIPAMIERGYDKFFSAALVAAFYGLIVGVFLYREMDFKTVCSSCVASCETSSIIIVLMAMATLFGNIMTIEDVPGTIARWMLSITESKIIILLLINVLLLIVGVFMEALAAIVILTPILLPVVTGVGVSPLHFGIIMVVNLAIGFLTPPVGVNLFVASGVAQAKIEKIAVAVLPMIALMLIVLAIITYCPSVPLMLVH
jgi:TRAP-type C4-dicarboxylate transport system permease large subunit/TRAP-type C4-dicarboxylate transport system permease small subunit